MIIGNTIKESDLMRYYKPNMAALSGKKGIEIIEFIKNQRVKTDLDIKERADACMERIKKMKESGEIN